ncbi:glycosyltransferase [Ideonella sp. 4Y11]|uniref:Glycosyltransferase n=1 Tax=Ideonella aquatica TaxID=2824119 RepID=A0A940YDV2_9BURK|nr:glycosyltransferase [Ideonella aquatica]MBQ0958340.1 glycosyltransferase [Ideonella aquatica]
MARRIALVDAQAGTGHRRAYAQTLINALRARGDDPVILGSPAWCASFAGELPCIEVAAVQAAAGYRARGRAFQAFLRAVFEAARAHQVDVVHLLYLDGYLQALLAVGIPTEFSTCATLHWYPFLGDTAGWRDPRRWLKAVLTRYWARRLVRGGVQLVVHSPAAQAGLAVDALVLDYPNFDTPPHVDAAAREAARCQLGLRSDDRLFLCFGGTRTDKGADRAIRALAGTPEHCHLLIAGAAQHLSATALSQLAQELGLAARVHLDLRFIPDQEVGSIFSAADVVLLPYREDFAGQSGPFVIGATMGLPVMFSDLPVMAETAERFRFGRRVSPASSLEALTQAMSGPLPPVASGEDRAALLDATDPVMFGHRMAAAYGTSEDGRRAHG